MKRFISIVLFLSLIFSLSVTSFAAPLKGLVANTSDRGTKYTKLPIVGYGKSYTYNSSSYIMSDKPIEDKGYKVSYGGTVYIPLLVERTSGKLEVATRADAVENLNVTAEWNENANYVNSIQVKRMKFHQDLTAKDLSTNYKPGYGFFIAISFANSTSLEEKTITGKLILKNSKSGYKVNGETGNLTYILGPTTPTPAKLESDTISSSAKTFTFGADEENYIFKISAFSGAQIETSVKAGEKLKVSATHTFNKKISAAYPGINFDFLNGNGARFKHGATLTIDCDEDSYLYRIDDNDKLIFVCASADNGDELTDHFVKFGKYAITDKIIDDPSESGKKYYLGDNLDFAEIVIDDADDENDEDEQED